MISFKLNGNQMSNPAPQMIINLGIVYNVKKNK